MKINSVALDVLGQMIVGSLAICRCNEEWTLIPNGLVLAIEDDPAEEFPEFPHSTRVSTPIVLELIDNDLVYAPSQLVRDQCILESKGTKDDWPEISEDEYFAGLKSASPQQEVDEELEEAIEEATSPDAVFCLTFLPTAEGCKLWDESTR